MVIDATLEKYIRDTKDFNHYLVKAFNEVLPYLSDFIPVYECYSSNFPKDVRKWLSEKMLLNAQAFNTKQFVQYACEATIVRYFADRFASTIEIEKKINPANKMDVDLVFKDKGFTFNMEIKCSDFNAKEKVDSTNALKIQPVGRLDGFDAILADLQELLKPVAERMSLDGIVAGRNMDNNLKDFLVSANNKFNASSTEYDLNILSVSCGDAEDMQLWYYYMFKDKGLFTSTSFYPKVEYENVDVVVLNNLYFKHYDYFSKKLLDSWDFGNCFNLIFVNPYAKQKKSAAIAELLNICPNQSQTRSHWSYILIKAFLQIIS
ncbi:MAG: hypothetical protein EOO43_14730 [Flavobacterium sp.]|nr:MAG: hypothetical protein EOO43_14730 [Flavobacterium sp.]